MRRGVNSLGAIVSILALTGLLTVTPAVPVRATSAAGGIRIAPAAIRLELQKGNTEAKTVINLTNTYTVPVTLQLAIEASDQNIRGTVDPTTLVSLDAKEITLTAGQAATENLTLHDAKGLSPGSQMVDLLVMQRSSPVHAGVGVQSAVRLPVTIIKDDGAVMSLGLTNIASPSFMMQSPQSVTVTAKNTGNVVTIPRGIVTIRDPRGIVIGQGVINTASAAVAPGHDLKLTVAITTVSRAITPGPYRITVTYGLGGNSSSKTASTTYLFMAWWHAALILALVVLLTVVVRNFRRIYHAVQAHHKKPDSSAAPPVKRQILIGKNA